MSFPELQSRELLLAAAAVLLAIGWGLIWLLRRPRSPEDAERRRRAHLNNIGRVVEGHVQEIIEIPPDPRPARKGLFGKSRAGSRHTLNNVRRLVRYSYLISGVTYETAQDVTGLLELAAIDRIAAGQAASVKYDPSNPSDSILVAEDWSGLH